MIDEERHALEEAYLLIANRMLLFRKKLVLLSTGQFGIGANARGAFGKSLRLHTLLLAAPRAFRLVLSKC